MANDKDQELLQIYIEEAVDLIASLSTTLRQWQENIQDLTKIADLKRDLHTLKGGARMVQQSAIGTLAHELETLCDALFQKKIPIDKTVFGVVLEGLDSLTMMIDLLKKNETPLPAEDIIVKFHTYLPKTESPAPEKKEAPIAKKTSATIKEEAAKTASLQQEVVRIRSDLLEKLDSLVTENSMLRIGIEQHNETIGACLLEAKLDLKQLEEQLNNLSTELEGLTIEDPSIEELNNGLRETTHLVVNSLKKLSEEQSNIGTRLLNQARINTELQLRLSNTRLVPFDSILPRLGRIVRQLSTELKKQVDFKIAKSEGEMDRKVLEHLVPSLEHILRNALDHGIESTAERRKKGKPDVGKIEISFSRTGSNVLIEIQDDGGGINPDIIRKKALQIGLLKKGTVVSDEEVIRYILEPGFSTREVVSEISGRGVGMDVVNMAVKEMGGSLSIESSIGVGTRFILRFPFTISLNRVMLFTVQDKTYGMVLANIESVVNLKAEESYNATFEYNNQVYHLHSLGALLNNAYSPPQASNNVALPVILFSTPEYAMGLIVDSILFSRELIIQALSGQLKLTNDCNGATILGDGRVVFILDPYALSSKAHRLSEATQRKTG